MLCFQNTRPAAAAATLIGGMDIIEPATHKLTAVSRARLCPALAGTAASEISSGSVNQAVVLIQMESTHEGSALMAR